MKKKIYNRAIKFFMIAFALSALLGVYTLYESSKIISGLKSILANESKLSLNFDDFVVESETIVNQNSEFIKEKAESEFKENSAQAFVNFLNSIEPLIKTSVYKGDFINGAWFTANPDLLLVDQKQLILQHHYFIIWYYWDNGQLQKARFNEENITPQSAPFYYEPVKANRMVFVKPYMDTDIKKELISLGQPVYKNQTLLGVIGIDIETDIIKKELQGIKLKMDKMRLYIFDVEGNPVSGTGTPSKELSQFIKDTVVNNDLGKFSQVTLIDDNLVIVDDQKNKGAFFVTEILFKDIKSEFNAIVWAVYIVTTLLLLCFLNFLITTFHLFEKAQKAYSSFSSNSKIIPGYKLINKIGSGGMGQVWLAEQKSMHRLVALKILPPELNKRPHFLDRFLKEIKNTAKLEHPNIISAIDSGYANGVYYLASLYIKGKNLSQILEEKQIISEIDSLKIALAIAKALDYAWEEFSIIHRDIKPGNIMVDINGVSKLLDFGISKDLLDDNSLTVQHSPVGTSLYMSPEQAMSEEVDFRTDIYSFGATLYHISTGTPPFESESNLRLAIKHVSLDIEPPIKRNMNISNAFNSLICKMMNKDKELRHKSWEEVISEINLILNTNQ